MVSNSWLPLSYFGRVVTVWLCTVGQRLTSKYDLQSIRCFSMTFRPSPCLFCYSVVQLKTCLLYHTSYTLQDLTLPPLKTCWQYNQQTVVRYYRDPRKCCLGEASILRLHRGWNRGKYVPKRHSTYKDFLFKLIFDVRVTSSHSFCADTAVHLLTFVFLVFPLHITVAMSRLL